MNAPSSSLSSCLNVWQGLDSSPALTWYGNDGRCELSGRVISNWIIKTANFAKAQSDFGTGVTMSLDCTWHWKTFVFVLGALTSGFTLNLDRQSDVLLSNSGVGDAEELWVFNPHSLATRLPEPAVFPALDLVTEVRQQPDELMQQVHCFSDNDIVITFPDGETFTALDVFSPADTELIQAADGSIRAVLDLSALKPTPENLLTTWRKTLSVILAGGSLVVSTRPLHEDVLVQEAVNFSLT